MSESTLNRINFPQFLDVNSNSSLNIYHGYRFKILSLRVSRRGEEGVNIAGNAKNQNSGLRKGYRPRVYGDKEKEGKVCFCGTV